MANANGVWIKTHVYREGNFLKADVHLVTMGEPTVFTVGVDMARLARAVKAYHDRHLTISGSEAYELGDCVGCDCIGSDCDDNIGSLFGNVVKAVKNPKATIKRAGELANGKLTVVKVAEPAKRAGGGKVSSVDELIDKLKNEAKVI